MFVFCARHFGLSLWIEELGSGVRVISPPSLFCRTSEILRAVALGIRPSNVNTFGFFIPTDERYLSDILLITVLRVMDLITAY